MATVKIKIDHSLSVSGNLLIPSSARVCFVFAHGAGAGMMHPFMGAVATGLSERGIATLRYQFPYMEKGAKRPDRPAIAHATVRAAVVEAARHGAGLPLLAGGKSFGGRMTSQTQALVPLPGVLGLAFFGFPLHMAGNPSRKRADHLSDVHVPMLFLQGTRDRLAELDWLQAVTKDLGAKASLHLVEHADHSFHVPIRSGRTDAAVMHEILDTFSEWVDALLGNRI
jgi:predicted alpha/beta-hydrolase family hydrolase